MNFAQQQGLFAIHALRQQPEFAAFSKISVQLADIEPVFEVSGEGVLVLAERLLRQPLLFALHLRQGLEFIWLVRRRVVPGRALLAASRAACLYALAEAEAVPTMEWPGWVRVLAREVAPPGSLLTEIAGFLPSAIVTAADVSAVRAVWGLLGTAESLMETGGDIRLQTDPRSALNGYGCSHRPRPWAVTFASSTASSSSARGYIAADKKRLQTTAALLKSNQHRAVGKALAGVRSGLAAVLGLPKDAQIILAASGTDTELLALAVTHLATPVQPILNILIAPEETGRGVPMAARGLHFAVDTALGHDVTFQAPISGFRPDTELGTVALREPDGTVRKAEQVEAEIRRLLTGGIAAGKRVILHALDLSKTGLLAPSPAFLRDLRAAFGCCFDIVVDACQVRLSPGSVNEYLAMDAMVLITGSKFFTGPPFAGAAILPASVAARLATGRLPEGLDAYFGRDEFPEPCVAALYLPPTGNYGLSLRWHAALAEAQAFLRVTPQRRAEIIGLFGAVVAREIAANPLLEMLPHPPVERYARDELWERLPTIFSFSLRAAHAPERCLSPAEARQVYVWLNADLSAALPHGGDVARRICHIGQPVVLPQPPGIAGYQGVLRVSAGARLISGEPSHKGLNAKTRIMREMDDLAMVFKKIDLILRNWAVLSEADPQPSYRPGVAVPVMAHENVSF